MKITTTNDYGIDADAKEAIAFAVLAYRTHRGRTGNLPWRDRSEPARWCWDKITPAC